MDLKRFIGEKSKLQTYRVTRECMSAFAQAVGANVSPISDTRQLPTFLTLFRDSEFELLERMGVELKSVLHGEQEYQYENVIEAGDLVAYQSHVANVMSKSGKSGSLHFLIVETRFEVTEPRARPVGSAKTTVIYREAAQGSAKKSAQGSVQESAP